MHISVAFDGEALSRHIFSLIRARPWLSVALAILLFVVLALILAPLLSFVLAAAIGAGSYALFVQRGGGAARLGRMHAADLAGRRRGFPSLTLLFLDLAALALLGGGTALLALAGALNAETAVAFGLGAAAVVIARAT